MPIPFLSCTSYDSGFQAHFSLLTKTPASIYTSSVFSKPTGTVTCDNHTHCSSSAICKMNLVQWYLTKLLFCVCCSKEKAKFSVSSCSIQCFFGYVQKKVILTHLQNEEGNLLESILLNKCFFCGTNNFCRLHLNCRAELTNRFAWNILWLLSVPCLKKIINRVKRVVHGFHPDLDLHLSWGHSFIWAWISVSEKCTPSPTQHNNISVKFVINLNAH